MKTKDEWITLASGERRCVAVQKRVVARSIWKRAPEEGGAAAHGDQKEEKEDECNRFEVRYERSARDPSRYNIVELRRRELVLISEEETSDSDMDYTTEGKDDEDDDDDDSEVSSYDEGRAFWEFRKDIKQLAQEAAEAQGEGHAAAGFSGHLGRGQRRKSTVNAASQQPAMNKEPEPPGLTAVRLLFALSSPGYRKLLTEGLNCLWIVRRCNDGHRNHKISSMESVMRLCKQAGLQPKLVRHLGHGVFQSHCWLIELHRPEDGQLLAGQDGEYTSFFENDLFIWQKVKLEDLIKITQWHIKSLPPYLASLTREQLERTIGTSNNYRYVRPLFKSIDWLQHDYLSGSCVIRGVTNYTCQVSSHFLQSVPFSSDDEHGGKEYIAIKCVEQCTFCGLDCSAEGEADYHDAQTCPYKTILQRHRAQQAA